MYVQLRPRESFAFLSNQSRMASWRRSDFRSYINAVRETFVRLGRKELEGNILRKLGKGWPAGFHGDLCSWSEACGGGQRWPGRKWGKKTRKGKLLRPFCVNKEGGKSEKGLRLS